VVEVVVLTTQDIIRLLVALVAVAVAKTILLVLLEHQDKVTQVVRVALLKSTEVVAVVEQVLLVQQAVQLVTVVLAFKHL
jgi:hypothetical protein